jgi:hypothetical protein
MVELRRRQKHCGVALQIHLHHGMITYATRCSRKRPVATHSHALPSAPAHRQGIYVFINPGDKLQAKPGKIICSHAAAQLAAAAFFQAASK